MFLAGDVGGTKTAIALFEERENKLHITREMVVHSAEYASLEEAVGKFLSATPQHEIRAACFGVPGIVMDGRCHATNLPWVVDERELARKIGGCAVKLINDLEATALGMLELPRDQFETIQAGATEARVGNVGVIAAGTGLGEAVLHWTGARFEPLACEAGHADFAPRTELEIELLRYLKGMLGGHVSYERVISGPGIHNIYQFLRDYGFAPEAAWVADELRASADPSAVISELGTANKDRLCRMTIETFSTIYGAEAGNLALRCLAIGGIYLGGGIAPKIKSVLMDGSFMQGFLDKGRLRQFLEQVPVFIAMNERAALLGAARCATRLMA